jgi:hypothetical protein
MTLLIKKNNFLLMIAFELVDVPKFELSLQEIFYYTKDKLDILKDFLKVRNYHGNIGDILNGDHGFNLCKKDIKEDFSNLFVEQRARILRIFLYSDNLEEITKEEQGIIERYNHWRDHELVILYRALFMVFERAFAMSKNLFPLGYNAFLKNTNLGIVLSMKKKLQKTLPVEVDTYKENFPKIRYLKLNNRSQEIIDNLKKIENFGIFLKKKYTFTEICISVYYKYKKTDDDEKFCSKKDLFKMLNLRKEYFEVFNIVGIYWLPFKYFKREEIVIF